MRILTWLERGERDLDFDLGTRHGVIRNIDFESVFLIFYILEFEFFLTLVLRGLILFIHLISKIIFTAQPQFSGVFKGMV